MEPAELSNVQKQGAWLPILLAGLCAAQPLLDVLSYWLLQLGRGSAVSLLLRILLFAATLVLAYALSARRRVYWLAAGCCVLLILCHTGACILAARAAGAAYTAANFFSDLANFSRVVQMPLFTLAFITCLRRCKAGYTALERGLLISFCVIVLVEILSALTGTNPYTYPNKSIGLVGWFYFANSQSAILSMLIPLVLCTVMRRGSFPATVAVAVVSFLTLYLFATRLTYLAIFVIAIGTLFIWAVNRKLDRRVAAVLLLCAILCAAGYGISPMTRNQALVAANATRKQEEIDRLVQRGTAEFGTDDSRYLTYAYNAYLGGLVKRYGLEAVAAQYHNSTDAAVIANVRTLKLNYCRLMRAEAPVTSRLFGLSIDEMTYDGYCYDVENDFHGILYLYGDVGLLCMLAFLTYFLVLIAKALCTNTKQYFTVEAGACGIALCMGLVHAYATAGILRRPNASFYLSLVLAMIWYLIKLRHYDDSKENNPNGN